MEKCLVHYVPNPRQLKGELYMDEVRVLTREDLALLADPFAQLMNQMQRENGENINDLVSAGLYAMGCAIEQAWLHIDIKLPINEGLTPLSLGYQEAMEAVKKKMI
jgi:hypothetical protein